MIDFDPSASSGEATPWRSRTRAETTSVLPACRCAERLRTPYVSNYQDSDFCNRSRLLSVGCPTYPREFCAQGRGGMYSAEDPSDHLQFGRQRPLEPKWSQGV